SATPKAIVKEVAFNRWTKYARAKDVTEFNAAEKTDIILRRDVQSETKIRTARVPKSFTRKRSVSSAVLIDVRAHVDRAVKTDPVKFGRRRRRGDLFVRDRLPGMHR